MNDCIARNGGAPVAPEPDPAPDAGQGTAEVSEPNAESSTPDREEVEEEIEFCFASYEFFEDLWILMTCLGDLRDDGVLTSFEVLFYVLMRMCFFPYGLIVFMGAGWRWRRRRHKLAITRRNLD
jgi:hypothetical protein